MINRKHILELSNEIDLPILDIWINCGLQCKLYQYPPSLTEYPEVQIHRGIYLKKIAKKISAKHIVEIGTARGWQSLLFAKYVKESKFNGRVFTCDIVSSDEPVFEIAVKPGELFTRSQLWRKYEFSDLITFVHGDSSKLKEYLQNLEPCKIDLVFIDGEHTEEAVMQDFYNMLPFCDDKSVYFFDDCDPNYNGIEKAVSQISEFLGKKINMIDFYPSSYQVAIIGLDDVHVE